MATDSAQAATIVFDNETAGTLYGYWVDYSGVPEPWFSLNTGDKLTQDTFVTHPWAILDVTGACLGVYLPVAGSGQVTLK